MSKPSRAEQNRKTPSWSKSENFRRVLWTLSYPFFRYSPRPFWAWRRMLLRTFGAKIGAHTHIYPTVKVAIPWNIEIGKFCAVGDNAILYSLGKIVLDDDVTISQGAHLCAGTHDLSVASKPLLKLPIQVGIGAWICADAFVGPNVVIGENSILGARAVTMSNISAGAIFVGNPAVFLRNNSLPDAT